jgi:antirestriction protein
MTTSYDPTEETIAEETFEDEGHSISWDAWQAYVALVGDDYATIEDAEEAYQGSYGSDEEFAEELADELGLIDSGAAWPLSYIDWERAARDLMMGDYSEQDGHYFRNM